MFKSRYLIVGLLILVGTGLYYMVEKKNIGTFFQSEEYELVVDPNENANLKSEIAISESGQSEQAYKVQKVIDGDTIAIDIDGSIVTLRLIGANTPETVDPRKPVECFGLEASSQTKLLVSDQRVVLEFDTTQGYWDKYNRLLAYVYREDGLFLNKTLIENGYAYEYTYNTPYKYKKEFDEAEEQARTKEKGLWAPEACKAFIEAQELDSGTEPIEGDAVKYTCAANIYNCSNFSKRMIAQDAYLSCGGVDYDVHNLDADKDGQACESLP